jgi:Family of unknown function (DUF6527)
MKLIDLNPKWLHSGGEGITNSITHEPVPINEHAAVGFDCPDGCGSRRFVPVEKGHGHVWQVVGDFSFEDLTLSPSIQVTSGCKTHFHIKHGEITP